MKRTLHYIAAQDVRDGDRILFSSSDRRTARKVLGVVAHSDPAFVQVWVHGETFTGKRCKCFDTFKRTDTVKVLR